MDRLDRKTMVAISIELASKPFPKASEDIAVNNACIALLDAF